ncbi:RNA helicase [Mesonia sp. MT50]|uniref:RNA helicase n=1 Tax=Mesonia profundi TaxID=3070998 RepID=A0ABU1A4T2_9FLAO|nr:MULTISPECIES: RNA helicase [Flavobacteriaceae]MDQ7918705.1 RNA helicase [Mesonia profundi]
MAKRPTKSEKENTEQLTSKKCGIIMPIAKHPDYQSGHWKDVLDILTEAISETEFEPRLVSDDVAIGLIHDRIVTNIYNDEIVVCDVSSKNPNVMFELGLRLAFDKPTIIVKDEKTGYSFDTGVIEHISYPSSLRFSEIVDFKEELAKRINATYAKSQAEKDYSPFLKSFGKTIVPTSLEKTEIPESKFIMEQLSMIRHEMRRLRNDNSDRSDNYRNNIIHSRRPISISKLRFFEKFFSNLSDEQLNNSDFYSELKKEALDNGLGDITMSEIRYFIDKYSNINKSE